MNPIDPERRERSKRWIRVALFTFVLAATAALAYLAVARNELFDAAVADDGIEHYTCPMHPHVHKDGPGNCPICGMPLIPVMDQKAAAPSGSAANESAPSLYIAGDRQQRIGVRTAAVQRSPAQLLLRAPGRAAFDPELGVAIREYLSVASDPSLRNAASTRLKLLGMGAEEIRDLHRRSAAYAELLAPDLNGARWVYASVYETEMALVRPGMAAEVQAPHAGEKTRHGVVRSLSPTVDPQTRSVRVRIELRDGAWRLRPDSFVNVTIRVDLGRRLIIPRSAIIDTGLRQIVYVSAGDGHFELREISTGGELENGVIIEHGLAENEEIVVHGAFLVDAEAQLHGVSGSGSGSGAAGSAGHPHGAAQ